MDVMVMVMMMMMMTRREYRGRRKWTRIEPRYLKSDGRFSHG